MARTYLRKVDVLEREILHENVKSLTNNIIIAKTFNDEVRMVNRKRAIRLVSMHKERILNEMATEIEK